MGIDANHSWGDGDGGMIVQGSWPVEPPVSPRAYDASSVAVSTQAASRVRRAARCSCAEAVTLQTLLRVESEQRFVERLACTRNRTADRICSTRGIADATRRSGEPSRPTAGMRPELMTSALQSREAGEMCIDVDMLQKAQVFLQRAIELDGNDPHTLESMEECRRLINRPARWMAAGQSLRAQLDALNARARPVSAINPTAYRVQAGHARRHRVSRHESVSPVVGAFADDGVVDASRSCGARGQGADPPDNGD